MSKLKNLADWLKLFPFCFKVGRAQRDSAFFHSWAELSNMQVEREGYLVELCRGKRVLHFGFVDAPFSEGRLKAGALLHQKLKQASTFLFGADIEEKSLGLYRKLTGDMANAVVDVQSDSSFDQLAQNFDLVLFPEVLEHLLRPADALRNLKKICQLNNAAKLCITTPNAFSVTGIFAALENNELVHPEHYYYFSPSTLKKLLVDTGFLNIQLRLYSGANLLNSPGLCHHGLIAVCEP